MRFRNAANPRKLPPPQMHDGEEQAHVLTAASFPAYLIASFPAPFLEVWAGAFTGIGFPGQRAVVIPKCKARENIDPARRGIVRILQIEGIAIRDAPRPDEGTEGEAVRLGNDEALPPRFKLRLTVGKEAAYSRIVARNANRAGRNGRELGLLRTQAGGERMKIGSGFPRGGMLGELGGHFWLVIGYTVHAEKLLASPLDFDRLGVLARI
jgi:hypothetical protein